VVGEPVASGLALDESVVWNPNFTLAAQYVMSPPIRSAAHRDALKQVCTETHAHTHLTLPTMVYEALLCVCVLLVILCVPLLVCVCVCVCVCTSFYVYLYTCTTVCMHVSSPLVSTLDVYHLSCVLVLPTEHHTVWPCTLRAHLRAHAHTGSSAAMWPCMPLAPLYECH
jgi:hypothetical protein